MYRSGELRSYLQLIPPRFSLAFAAMRLDAWGKPTESPGSSGKRPLLGHSMTRCLHRLFPFLNDSFLKRSEKKNGYNFNFPFKKENVLGWPLLPFIPGVSGDSKQNPVFSGLDQVDVSGGVSTLTWTSKELFNASVSPCSHSGAHAGSFLYTLWPNWMYFRWSSWTSSPQIWQLKAWLQAEVLGHCCFQWGWGWS